MRVGDVMSEAKCCSERTPVREVARLMKEESIGFVPICNESGEPVGAITDRDLAIRVLADGRPADEPISAVATRAVFACKLDDDVHDAERLMRERRTSRIMVCGDDGKLRGVVSLADIADALSEDAAGQTLKDVKSDQPPAQH